MGLGSYAKVLVTDNVDRVVATHHNNQENQIESVTNHSLIMQSLLPQSTSFGTVTAGTASEKAIFVAPYACRITAMWLVNGANLASNGINYTTLDLVNKGANGAGATVLTTFNGSTESFTAFDAVLKTLATTDLAAGDVLSLKKTDFGAGMLVTDLLVLVAYKPIP